MYVCCFTCCVIIVFDYLFCNVLGDSSGLALLSGCLLSNCNYILTNIWLLTTYLLLTEEVEPGDMQRSSSEPSVSSCFQLIAFLQTKDEES